MKYINFNYKEKNIKNINNIQSFDNLIRVNEFTFLQK